MKVSPPPTYFNNSFPRHWRHMTTTLRVQNMDTIKRESSKLRKEELHDLYTTTVWLGWTYTKKNWMWGECSMHRRDSKYFFFLWRCGPTRAMASSFMRFLDHTQRRITVGRTPLDEWSARRRDLYLTTHNTHNRQTPKPPVGFEPTISAGERPQTYALDRAATGTGIRNKCNIFYWKT